MATAERVTAPPPTASEVCPLQIKLDAFYTFDDVKALLGVSSQTLRREQRRGLTWRRLGRKKIIMGRELVAFMEGSQRGSNDA